MCDHHLYYKKLLGHSEWTRLTEQSKQVQKLESKYETEITNAFNMFIESLVRRAEMGLEPDWEAFDIEEILVRHQLETMIEAYRRAESERELKKKPKLAAPPRPKLPRSLKDLMRLWDAVRKRPAITKRARVLAERVRKEYLKKVQSVWKKHGEDFRTGKTASKDEAVQNIIDRSRASYARAKTIISTETTYYDNKARTEFYDELPEVTHYLFLAIRDHATTPWCKTRHGTVFTKDSDLMKASMPPCHWSCRSEIVPLSPYNPRHRQLIEDKSRLAETRYKKFAPLPKGWNAR